MPKVGSSGKSSQASESQPHPSTFAADDLLQGESRQSGEAII